MKLLFFMIKQTIFCWGFKSNCLWLLNYDPCSGNGKKKKKANGDAASQKGETRVLIQKCRLKDNPGNKEAIDNCIQPIAIRL